MYLTQSASCARPKNESTKTVTQSDTKQLEADKLVKSAVTKIGQSHLVLALQDCNKALSLNPKQVDAYLIRSGIYSATGRPDKALGDCNQAVRLAPNWAITYYARSNSLLACGKDEAAISDCNRAIALDNRIVGAYNTRGAALCNLRCYKQAVPDLERASRLNPNIPAVYGNLCEAYRGLKQPQKALTYANRAIALAPKLASSYNHRGNTFVDLKQWQKAIADFERARALGFPAAVALANETSAYTGMREWQKALECATRSISLDPNLSHAHSNRAVALIGIGKYASALSDCNEAIRLNAKNASAFNNRGICFVKLQRTKEGLAEFNKSLSLDPEFAQALLNRGALWEMLGDPVKAVVDLDRGLRMEPSATGNYAFKSRAEAALGHMEQATADYQYYELLKKKNEFPKKKTLNSFDLTSVINYQSKLISGNLATKDTYFDRGMLYLVSKRPDLAISDFQHFLELSSWQERNSMNAVTLLYLANRMLGKEKLAQNKLVEATQKVPAASWSPEFLYLKKLFTEEKLLSFAKSREGQTRARCIIGLNLLLSGDRKKARQNLLWVKENGEQGMDEYYLALASL